MLSLLGKNKFILTITQKRFVIRKQTLVDLSKETKLIKTGSSLIRLKEMLIIH